MSHTPDIPNINKIRPLSSPINKKLLTPCRRVGLSRIRKTPNSIVKRVSENSPINNNNEVIIQTTPVNHKKSLKRNVIDHPQEVSSTTDNSLETERKPFVNSVENYAENYLVEKKSKKHLFQSHSDDVVILETKIHDTDSLITRNICCTNDNPNTSGINQGNDSDDFKVTNKYDKEQRDSLITKNVCHTNNNPNTSNISPGNDFEDDFKVTNKYDEQKHDSLNTKNICYTNNNPNTSDITRGNDSEDDFKVTNKYHKLKQKTKENSRKTKTIKHNTTKKAPSIKKSENVTSEAFEEATYNQETPNFKGCTVLLQDMCGNGKNVSSKNKILTNKSCDNSKDVKDEEEDAFTSTPEQEKIKKAEMIQKVKDLENIIEQKKNHLEYLKRASVYSSKHNIEDLAQLTSKWKTGCVSGLNDLLTQLQAHGPMNMNTLLNNLHIPSDMVTKLSLSVD